MEATTTKQKKLSPREVFFERNAKRGRTVRFKCEFSIAHVPPEQSRGRVGIKISDGTLAPERLDAVYDLLLHDGRLHDALVAVAKAARAPGLEREILLQNALEALAAIEAESQ